jgi:hypothetical protein
MKVEEVSLLRATTARIVAMGRTASIPTARSPWLVGGATFHDLATFILAHV